MNECSPSRIDALVRLELSPDARQNAERHVETCADCAAELVWLKRERDLLVARKRDLQHTDSLWSGIEARIARPTPSLWQQLVASLRRASIGLCVVAVAAATMFLWTQSESGAPAPLPSTSMVQAERADSVVAAPIVVPTVLGALGAVSRKLADECAEAGDALKRILAPSTLTL